MPSANRLTIHILAAVAEHERELISLEFPALTAGADYQRCVLGAPMKHGENKPDISRADFFWVMMCAQRGHGVDQIAVKLMELSDKAKENGERYAKLTAQNAVAASEGQRRSRA